LTVRDAPPALPAAAAAASAAARLGGDADDWAGLAVRTFDYASGVPAETVDGTAHLRHHVALVTGAAFTSAFASPTAAVDLLRRGVVPTAAAAAAFHDLTAPTRRGPVDTPVSIAAALHAAHDVPWAFVRSLPPSHQRELLRRLDAAGAVAPPDRKPRVLFLHVQFGLGNRLRSLGAGMALAAATGRELVLIWERDVHLDATFHDFFTNDLLCVERLRLGWPFDTRADDKLAAVHALTFMRKDRVDVLSAGAHVLDVDAVASQHLYIKTAYVVRTTVPLMEDGSQAKPYSPVCLAMRTLTPVVPVLRLVEGNVANGVADTIGVHVRSRSLARDIVGLADPVAEYGSEKSLAVTEYWRNTTQLPAFVDKMRSFNDSSLRFYVAADDAEAIAALTAAFPGRILHTPRSCDDRGRDCLRYALADMILLSRTKLILGSYWSSFTEAAMRLGSQKVHLAGVDFGVNKEAALPGAIVSAMHPRTAAVKVGERGGAPPGRGVAPGTAHGNGTAPAGAAAGTPTAAAAGAPAPAASAAGHVHAGAPLARVDGASVGATAPAPAPARVAATAHAGAAAARVDAPPVGATVPTPERGAATAHAGAAAARVDAHPVAATAPTPARVAATAHVGAAAAHTSAGAPLSAPGAAEGPSHSADGVPRRAPAGARLRVHLGPGNGTAWAAGGWPPSAGGARVE